MKRKYIALASLLLVACYGLNFNNNESEFISVNEPITHSAISRSSIGNGTYEVPLELDLKMGQEAFDHTAIIERQDRNVYMTFTQLDSSNLKDMTLLLPGKTGEMLIQEGARKDYIYTVSEDDLYKPFPFSVIVTVMDKLVNFNMTLSMDQITYKSETIRDLGERPARYVPVIDVNMVDMELEKNSLFVLPKAIAKLNEEEIDVSVNAYYNRNGLKEEVPIESNMIKLANIGEYEIVYTAESDLYQTSIGNNTKAVETFKIISKVGASVLGKFEDPNDVLPDTAQIQTNIIDSGEGFEIIKDLMTKIGENYEVFQVDLFLDSGESVTPDGEIILYLRANDYFDRQKVKISHLESDGTLKELALENYGRYMRFKTTEVGNFVVYTEGFEFKMPIWGYVCIGVGSLIVVAGAITGLIIYKKKKNKVSKE